jgi:hypothetical protein
LNGKWKYEAFDQATKVTLVFVTDIGWSHDAQRPASSGSTAIRLAAIHLRRVRIAVKLSSAPIAAKMWLR